MRSESMDESLRTRRWLGAFVMFVGFTLIVYNIISIAGQLGSRSGVGTELALTVVGATVALVGVVMAFRGPHPR